MNPLGTNDGGSVWRAPKWLVVTLIVLGATILGATVLREPIAYAAQALDAKITGPLDGQGNVKVHEAGTAAVDVTNASIPVEQAGTPITIRLSGPSSGLYGVPQGKRLVIQHVYALYDLFDTQDPFAEEGLFAFTVIGNHPDDTYRFVGTKRELTNTTARVVSEAVTIYAGANDLIQLRQESEVRLSGYLLDMSR